jgi:hypothetical protein
MRVKAQVAMEYLMIVGFSLLLLIPLLALFSGTFSSDQTFLLTQSAEVSREIISASEQTFYQGPGSKQVLTINIPRGFQSVAIRSHEVENPSGLTGTTFNFETTRGLTATHRSRIPIEFEDIDLAQPGVYELVIETIDGGNQLQISDDVIRISRKND